MWQLIYPLIESNLAVIDSKFTVRELAVSTDRAPSSSFVTLSSAAAVSRRRRGKVAALHWLQAAHQSGRHQCKSGLCERDTRLRQHQTRFRQLEVDCGLDLDADPQQQQRDSRGRSYARHQARPSSYCGVGGSCRKQER